MTAEPHPQKEYIITEERLRDIIYFAYVDPKDESDIHEGIKEAVAAVRSCPHTPAKSEQEIREKVLDILHDKVPTYPSDLGDMMLVSDIEEELRSKHEAPR